MFRARTERSCPEGVDYLLQHQHGGRQKLAGNGQPDEILRKEGQSWGSRRDSHEPKTTAVKTIRQGGDAKTAALSCERNGNLREIAK